MAESQTSNTARRGTALLALLAANGCTQLGPMPATTALSAVPAGRPHVEGEVGFVPGYYLSSAAGSEPRGAAVRQFSASLEPDRWIGVPGLVVGGRAVGGGDSDVYAEPFAGYRHAFGAEQRFSLLAVGFGTHTSATERRASYEATRIGAELASDLRVTPRSHWLELHALLGGSLSALDANGDYCLDSSSRYAVDCEADMQLAHASVSGFYPALNLGLAFDVAQHLEHYFHGVRLAALFAAGTMPRVLGAQQVDPETYSSFGVSISMGIGAKTANDDVTR